MTEDTDPPQSVQRLLDLALAVLCWALAALGILCAAWPVLPAMAHDHHIPTNEWIADLIGVGGMTLMAPYACLLEWAERHDRLRVKFWRRIGWCSQAFLVVIDGADAADHHKYPLIALTVVCVVAGAGAWSAWMQTQFLPPEDQAVVDELIIERDRRVAAAAKAADERRREERLQRAVSRYQPAGAPTVPGQQKPEEQTGYPWPIPEGKHQPLIYFVRNGDRVKIGTTTNVRNRMSGLSLRTSNIVLLLSGGRLAEQGLHRQFATQRVGNTEWFQYAGPVAEYVAQQIAEAHASMKQKG